MASPPTPQKNVVANPAIGCVFFENKFLSYNYRTDQWSLLSAYNDGAYVGTNNQTRNVGRLIFNGTAVELQYGGTVAQDAVFETGETDPNPFGVSTVLGVRPLTNGGTSATRVGSRNSQQDAVTYTTSTSVTTRTQMADFRSDGRYHRVETTLTGGFTTAWGADIDVVESGEN